MVKILYRPSLQMMYLLYPLESADYLLWLAVIR